METFLKFSLLRLVETDKKSFYKEIRSNLQANKNLCAGDFWRGVIFGCSFRNWRVTGRIHSNLKIGGKKV